MIEKAIPILVLLILVGFLLWISRRAELSADKTLKRISDEEKADNDSRENLNPDNGLDDENRRLLREIRDNTQRIREINEKFLWVLIIIPSLLFIINMMAKGCK